ncbi:MAG: gamma-glutamylcyclotransferase [Planctomycetales bacterium]|nr:gamma-glutamylcyclotransferase [Planctomycetales bacterium]
MNRPTSFFVYGTLKRGQIRETLWPCVPLQIRHATVRAVLHDLGPYPGITIGEDTVAGELWTFCEADIDRTIEVLDEIEWYQQDGNDLYVRQIVPCACEDAAAIDAFAYFYANTAELTSDNRIVANSMGISSWPQS